MITSVPVGGVSGRLFAMVLDSQDFGLGLGLGLG